MELENPIYVGIHMNKFSVEKYRGLQVYYSANDQGSVGIANKIKDNTRLYLQPYNKREIKKANSSIYILNNIDCPAVLVECGFLSNNVEAELLKTDAYRRKMAYCIALGIQNYTLKD
jgi:N-acetylmuramoyl-L-alanine amidase